MTYRIMLRPAEGGYDAWVPEMRGCTSVGATEAEAIRNIKRAIRQKMDLNRKRMGSAETVTERTVEVELTDCLHNRKETSAPADLQGPVPLGAWPQIVVGGAIFIMALVGVAFYFCLPAGTSLAFLFVPMLMATIGLPGLLFGLMTLSDRKAIR